MKKTNKTFDAKDYKVDTHMLNEGYLTESIHKDEEMKVRI